MRRRYVWDDKAQKLVEYGEYRRSFLAPTVYSDTIDRTYCDADGKYYESRSAMNRGIKEAGCELVGADEKLPQREERSNYNEIIDEMKRSYNDLVYGNVNLSEYDKHVCKELNERNRRK